MKDQGRLFDGFLLLLTVMGVLVAAIALVGMTNRPEAQAGPPTGGPNTDAQQPAADVVVAHVTLTEFAIEGDLTIPPGDVRLEVHNAGAIIHNLGLEGGPVSADIAGGQSTTLELGHLEPGSYELICAVPGHKEAGMRATLTVTEGAEAPTGEQAHGHGDEVDWAELDRAMTESMLAFPAETEGVGNQPLEPTVVDGVKQFEITAAITPWEVSPGEIVDAWTYNGMVPGPMIKVDVGDRVRVIVHNQLPMGTDVHWHGIDTPNGMDGVAPYTQPLIAPGETFVYEFVAEAPSVGMYHAHHHAQMQVPNGLFAPFLIGDTSLPLSRTIGGIELPAEIELAAEIPMVLNDAGVIGLSLNGKSFPATHPYVVEQGDWILVHYFNEGLQIHPMHLHQFPQMVVAKDGMPLDSPYWADTVNVAPGERYTVLVNAEDPGTWVWHCHILTHVESEQGMFGMVTALVVQPGG